MEDTFVGHLGAARQRGAWAVARVWLRASWDAARSGLRERGLRDAWDGNSNQRGGEGMRSVLSDLRYALRALARRPVLTVAAAGTLALGIGANTAIFSIVNGLLFRPLPYADADRLVQVWAEQPERGWSHTDVNLADAWDWRARAGVFQDLAVYGSTRPVLTGGDHPEQLAGVVTTPGFLGILGVRPALGRDFVESDAGPDAPSVVILTDGFWQRRFGGDPDVLGSEIVLNEQPRTVVGILPRDFRFMDSPMDVLAPLTEDPSTASRSDHNMEAVARLRDGVDLGAARRAVNEVARALQAEHPDTNDGWVASVIPLRDEILGPVAKQASLVLSAAVGFLLLMACVNVANLLLARADSRQGEMAVRTALGAGRGRLVRQMLTESAVLSLVGGISGMALAEWGRRYIVAGLPANLPPSLSFEMDWRVLAFALTVTLGSALAFGLVPALRTAQPAGDLRQGRRVAGGGRAGGTLVVVQTALAAVLLVAGIVMARSIVGMQSQDFGWAPDGVVYMRVTPPQSRYESSEELDALYRDLDARLEALPGVTAAGEIQSAPLQGSNWATTVQVPGGGDRQAEEELPARLSYVSDTYFRTMGLEVRSGRGLESSDAADDAAVVVNEAFQRRYLPVRDPVGASLVLSDGSSVSVVGVVQDHVERGVDRPFEPSLYRPMRGSGVRVRTVVVKAATDAAAVIPSLQEAVWAVDRDIPVSDVRTLDDWIVERVGGFRIIAELMGAFGVLSLVLGAVGIWGVTAYAVGRRTHEIGVRMAMGADRGSVLRMVVGQGARRVILGLVLGLALAVPAVGALRTLAVGVDPRDPAVFALVMAVLAGVSFLASWLPARRASGVDPVRALSVD